MEERMVKTFFIIVNNQASNGLKADVWQNIRMRLDSRRFHISSAKQNRLETLSL